MNNPLNKIIIKLTAVLMLMSIQPALSLEIESDFDILQSPNTTIEGLHRLFVGVSAGHNLSFGQALYSGASGDGGGAFFWGFEGVKRIPLTPDWNFALSGFLGGGGGAGQVEGDGTMWRVGAVGEYALTPNWGIRTGVSHVSISGASIDDWATSFGLRYQISDKPKTQRTDAIELAAVSARTSRFEFPNSLSRSGTSQTALQLMGAEASFNVGNRYSTFLGADGAVSGGDGYMQVLGGLRKQLPLGPVSLLGQTSVGFGGGGDVDTGGGLLVGAAAGITFPLREKFNFELTYGALAAIDTDLSGHGMQISLSRPFSEDGSREQKSKPQLWQVGLGMSAQPPNTSYMKSRSNVGIQPMMQESSIDLFISDNTYLTGNAQTTVSGGVAGYALGLLGMGHEFDVGNFWRLSIEGHVGAAGGGGVDVGNGLLGGARVEADYLLSPNRSVSLGFGHLKSFDGGLDVPIIQLGFKQRFTTH